MRARRYDRLGSKVLASSYEQLRAAAVDEVRRIERQRRAHAEIHVVGTLLVSHIDEHVAATAETAHPWLDRADGDGGGHRGIHGVAALGEHPRADLRSLEVLAHHHAGCRFHGRLAYLPGLDVAAFYVAIGHALAIRPGWWKMAPLSDSARVSSSSDSRTTRSANDAPLHEQGE